MHMNWKIIGNSTPPLTRIPFYSLLLLLYFLLRLHGFTYIKNVFLSMFRLLRYFNEEAAKKTNRAKILYIYIFFTSHKYMCTNVYTHEYFKGLSYGNESG